MSTNGAQSVIVEKGTIEFKNYSKQIPIPFKMYADFDCNLVDVDICEGLYTKKYQVLIPCSFAYKRVCINDRVTGPMVPFRGENAAYEFIKEIFEEYEYCKKVMKKHFNKNFTISEEEQQQFQLSNVCWMCKKLIDHDDEKVRDHCHVTGKFRGAAHWSCNINLQLTKKLPVIFQNLRGYDSHLIFNELKKFNVKIYVIQNGLEKFMAFFLNKNLVFTDNMQFMNSSLDKLMKNLADSDFKCLIKEIGSKNLELLKQNVLILMSTWTVLKDLMKKNFLIKNVFLVQ